MKFLPLLCLVLLNIPTWAQETKHQVKLDSILEEANLLYNYEKAVWNASDLLNDNRKLRKKNGGYVVFHSSDTITVSYFSLEQENSIARYHFLNSDMDKPIRAQLESSETTDLEIELLKTKGLIIEQLADEKYNLTIPKNYNPNLVLLKTEKGFKLYILMGTTLEGVIPFGNDYIFWTTKNGNINKWHKFHSRLIPARSEVPGYGSTVTSSHSHLRTTPYISATDICTFRLYADYTELESFSVYSPALKKTMEYNLEKNSLTIKD